MNINALIAKKVFGYTHDDSEPLSRYWFNQEGCDVSLLDYSNHIEAAWQIVEHLRPDRLVEITPWGDNYHVKVQNIGLMELSRAHHLNPAMAICLAVLKLY